MTYITKAEFRGAGSNPIVAQATTAALPDAQLDDLIEKASRYFDLLCGKTPGYFEMADTEPSERTFYGDGTHFLKIDRYVSGSLNATITVPSGYTAPDFIERDGYLRITDSGGVLLAGLSPTFSEGWWPNVPITISARWGFDSTPEDVKLAIIELSANLWRETDPANVKLVNLEGQPLREKYPPRVWEVARRYRVKGATFV